MKHGLIRLRQLAKRLRPDVEKPVIQSVVLFPANTTAGSKINVTVNATDNIGVSEVKAGNVPLVKDNDGFWKGNITAPSSRGDYSLLIKANDTVGNAAETSVPYHVVQACRWRKHCSFAGVEITYLVLLRIRFLLI